MKLSEQDVMYLDQIVDLVKERNSEYLKLAKNVCDKWEIKSIEDFILGQMYQDYSNKATGYLTKKLFQEKFFSQQETLDYIEKVRQEKFESRVLELKNEINLFF